MEHVIAKFPVLVLQKYNANGYNAVYVLTSGNIVKIGAENASSMKI